MSSSLSLYTFNNELRIIQIVVSEGFGREKLTVISGNDKSIIEEPPKILEVTPCVRTTPGIAAGRTFFFLKKREKIHTLEFAELKARVVGDPVIVWDKGNETLSNTSNKYAVSRNSEDFFTKHIADAQRRRRVHPSRSGSCAV